MQPGVLDFSLRLMGYRCTLRLMSVDYVLSWSLIAEIIRVCLTYLLWVSPDILHYLCLPGFFQFSETLALLFSCQHKMCHTEGKAGVHGAGPAVQHSTWTPPGSASWLWQRAATSCEKERESCFFPLLSCLWHHNWGAGSTHGDPHHKTLMGPAEGSAKRVEKGL